MSALAGYLADKAAGRTAPRKTRWEFDSSDKKKTYLVTDHGDDHYDCTCRGFRFQYTCKHVDIVRSGDLPNETPAEPVSVLPVEPEVRPYLAARRSAPTRRHDTFASSPAPDGVTTSIEEVEILLENALSLRHEIVLTSWGTIVGQSTRIPMFGDNECSILLHRVEVAEFLRAHSDLTEAAGTLLDRAKGMDDA